MKIKIILLIIISILSFNGYAEFSADHKIYSGDMNGDGYSDFFVKRPPKIILLHGEIVVPIVIPSQEDYLVLLQDANKEFYIHSTPSESEIKTLNTWPESAANIIIRDLNIDGIKDIYISNITNDPSFGAGFVDHIIYSPSSSNPTIKIADTDFKSFFEQVFNWSVDNEYFEKTALANGWYDLEGDIQTGWWFIGYVNDYYSYGDNEERFLDDDDDAFDESNTPAFCEFSPAQCQFYSIGGYWEVYGTFKNNIEVVIDYSNFHQSALDFKEAVLNSPVDPFEAEQIFESILEAELGETAAGVLLDPIPWPEQPPEIIPLPKPRPVPRQFPDPANDPDWFPKKEWKWIVIKRANVIICSIFCSAPGGRAVPEDVLWREIGVEWAIQDLLDNDVKEFEQPKVVIGEGEGGRTYIRVPLAALEYSAIYFSLGLDREGNEVDFTKGEQTPHTASLLWAFNQGWIRLMMFRRAIFYDIGLYELRSTRSNFYPCEREELKFYGSRIERSYLNTSGWNSGACNL